MRIFRTVSLSSLCFAVLAIFTISAIAQTTVSSPANGAEVVSPFNLSASARGCSNQPVGAMAYSLDNGTDTVVQGSSIQTPVEASAGLHTLHIKVWGTGGAECDTNTGIAVTPSNAINVSNIQQQGVWNWTQRNDAVVGGSSTGNMLAQNFGLTRQFSTTYTNSGGELYYVSFGSDTAATNFIYDAMVNIKAPVANVAVLEMDLNQVMANGQTVIYGFQCDSYSGTWDYTTNSGTPAKPVDQWIHSNAACNVSQWSPNTWHHVQISYSRDDAGNVTYNGVALDGVLSNINATVPSSFALGWGSTLLTNFQIDGRGSSGSSNVYLTSQSVYRW